MTAEFVFGEGKESVLLLTLSERWITTEEAPLWFGVVLAGKGGPHFMSSTAH
jgi:hypothetical protein